MNTHSIIRKYEYFWIEKASYQELWCVFVRSASLFLSEALLVRTSYMLYWRNKNKSCIHLGPVVQSVVSLTSSLMMISLTVLTGFNIQYSDIFC